MNIGGVSATGYPTGYEAGRTQRNPSADTFGSYVGKEKSAKASGMTLHCYDGEAGDTAVGAWGNAADGSSVTVYKTSDFDPANPVYKVKIWDSQGNVTERMVDISKVNPAGCDAVDMWAYASHLSSSGEYPGAQQEFMMSNALHRGEKGDSYGTLFEKTDWLEVVRSAMKMQYDAGNLKGYLDYKKFLDFLEGQD